MRDSCLLSGTARRPVRLKNKEARKRLIVSQNQPKYSKETILSLLRKHSKRDSCRNEGTDLETDLYDKKPILKLNFMCFTKILF